MGGWVDNESEKQSELCKVGYRLVTVWFDRFGNRSRKRIGWSFKNVRLFRLLKVVGSEANVNAHSRENLNGKGKNKDTKRQ